MKLDEQIIERVRNVDVIAFLEQRHGFTFAYRGGAFRCQQHPSLAVKADRLSWYWHSRGVGGHGALDYLVKAENMAFREAVGVITGATPQHRANLARQEAEPPKVLVLPEKRGIPLHLYDYLCLKRGIDGDIVNSLIQKEMLYEDRRGNVVFVGYDEQGAARFASLRGTYGDFQFRGDCPGSDKRYAFFMESTFSNQLYIFESPIDALSRATLENLFRNNKEAWKRRSYLSLAGTSDTALPFYLDKRPAVKELVFCLDKDDAGQEAATAMSKKYSDKGYYVRIEPPLSKDYNIDLMKYLEISRLEKSQKNAVKMHKETSL